MKEQPPQRKLLTHKGKTWQIPIYPLCRWFKRVYDKYIQSHRIYPRKLAKKLESCAKLYPGGEGYFGAINDYGNESGGAINEEESFRTIDAEDYLQWKVIPKVNVWPIQFSGLVAAAAQGGEESFANLVVEALDRARDRMLADENRQFFGLGTGILGSPAGNYTSTMTSVTVNSVQYFRKNQVIDFMSAQFYGFRYPNFLR